MEEDASRVLLLVLLPIITTFVLIVFGKRLGFAWTSAISIFSFLISFQSGCSLYYDVEVNEKKFKHMVWWCMYPDWQFVIHEMISASGTFLSAFVLALAIIIIAVFSELVSFICDAPDESYTYSRYFINFICIIVTTLIFILCAL